MLGLTNGEIVMLVLQLLVGAAVYGRLTERVKANGEALLKTTSMAEKHEGEIGVLYGSAGLARH